MRKPKIVLTAELSRQNTLRIRRQFVVTSERNDGQNLRESLKATDFVESRATWPYNGVPSDSVIRLTQREYPSRPFYGAGDEQSFLDEEERQRRLFLAFLDSFVSSLRVSLDVEIIDWVEFDENDRLQITTPEERANRAKN